MLVGGKRERKPRIPLEISFFPCWESCDWELRKDLKHIRFPLETNCSSSEEDKLQSPRLAAGRAVRRFCSNLEIS